MKRGKALLAIFSAGLLLTACGNPSEKGVEYLEKENTIRRLNSLSRQ